jgi:hypothetical protein
MLTKESVQSFRKEAAWSKYLLMILFIGGIFRGDFAETSRERAAKAAERRPDAAGEVDLL